MLDFVRNKQKSIIIKLAFAIIILSFVIGYAMLSTPGGPAQIWDSPLAEMQMSVQHCMRINICEPGRHKRANIHGKHKIDQKHSGTHR